MFSQVCLSSFKKKKDLKLDLKKVNAVPTRLSKNKVQPLANTWTDSVTQGPFFATLLRKGGRTDMEDFAKTVYCPQPGPLLACFGVFDGHRGVTAAQFAAECLLLNIKNYDETGVVQAFLDTDRAYCEYATRVDNKSGTTALVAVMNGDRVIAANAGDSRAVLISDNSCTQLTYDHVAADRSEQQRVESMGGYIMSVSGVQRVQGVLAITRGLGSPGFKQFVIPDPHVTSFRISPQDRVLVLASDGLYLKVPNEEIKHLVLGNLHKPLSSIATILADAAIARGSNDNICITLVDLHAVNTMAQPKNVLLVDEDEEMAEESTQMQVPTPRHSGVKGFF